MDLISPARHRDLTGRRYEPWIRRAGMLLLLAVVVLALTNRIGDQPTRASAGGPAATMTLSAPHMLRGGLLFQARLTIDARRDIRYPRLVLGRGWLEQRQINSIEPNPMQESSRDGLLVLSYDSLAAGDRLVVWLQFQANPTFYGGADQSIELDDQRQRVAVVRHHATVLP
jgi:hypothetical protein